MGPGADFRLAPPTASVARSRPGPLEGLGSIAGSFADAGSPSGEGEGGQSVAGMGLPRRPRYEHPRQSARSGCGASRRRVGGSRTGGPSFALAACASAEAGLLRQRGERPAQTQELRPPLVGAGLTAGGWRRDRRLGPLRRTACDVGSGTGRARQADVGAKMTERAEVGPGRREKQAPRTVWGARCSWHARSSRSLGSPWLRAQSSSCAAEIHVLGDCSDRARRGDERGKLIKMGPFSEPEEELISWIHAPLAKAISSPMGNAVSIGTRIGKGRPANQDRLLVARFADAGGETTDVVALCDGMGGMESGERCAELGIVNFVFWLGTYVGLGRHPGDALHDAARRASVRVYERYRGEGGTTLTALLFHRRRAWACTVGDTRLFGSGKDGLTRLSQDDTVGGALAEVHANARNGFDPAAEPEHLKLLQYVGMRGELQPHVFPVERPSSYQYLFICSDGAYRPPGGLLASLAAEASTARQLVERLCAVAEFVGGADDASVAAIDAQLVENGPPRGQPKHRTLQLWGPGPAQAATFLNFRPEFGPPFERRLPDRISSQARDLPGFGGRPPEPVGPKAQLPMPSDERPAKKGGKRKKSSPNQESSRL